MAVKDCFFTYSGERVTLHDGAPNVRTIGVSLGRVARFCGNCDKFYPVLCHVLTVAALLPEEIAIHGLLHDSQESVFSDVPTPMKPKLTRAREKKVLGRIYEYNEVPGWPLDLEIQELIDEADYKCLVAEAHLIGYRGAETIWGPNYDEDAGWMTERWLDSSPEQWLDAGRAANAFNAWFNYYLGQMKTNIVSVD